MQTRRLELYCVSWFTPESTMPRGDTAPGAFHSIRFLKKTLSLENRESPGESSGFRLDAIEVHPRRQLLAVRSFPVDADLM